MLLKLLHVLISIVLYLSQEAYALAEIDSAPLVISSEFSGEKPKGFEEKWSKVCEGFQKSFVDSGDKLGIFLSATCDLSTGASNPIHWRLNFKSEDKFVAIELSLVANGNILMSEQLRAESTKGFVPFVEAINGDNLRNLVQVWLPYWSRVKVDTKKARFTSSGGNDLKQLFLIKLFVAPNNTMGLQVLGAAKYRRNRRPGLRRFHMDSFFRGSDGIYLAARYYKKGEKEKLLKKAKEDLLSGMDFLKLLDSLLFDSLSSSLAGIRYGLPLISGGTIISETSYLSTMVEIRGGPVKGLRYYYDMAPKSTKSGASGEETFTWSRWYFGWSFDIPLPTAVLPFISRADVVPKLGGMSVNMDVVVDPDLDPLNVSTNNNLYTGIEVGLERDLAAFRVRLWGGADFSGALIAVEDTVTSQKIGADLTYDAMEFKNTKLTLLTFLNAERLSLEKGEKTDGTTTINNVSFNLAFFGLGVALSW